MSFQNLGNAALLWDRRRGIHCRVPARGFHVISFIPHKTPVRYVLSLLYKQHNTAREDKVARSRPQNQSAAEPDSDAKLSEMTAALLSLRSKEQLLQPEAHRPLTTLHAARDTASKAHSFIHSLIQNRLADCHRNWSTVPNTTQPRRRQTRRPAALKLAVKRGEVGTQWINTRDITSESDNDDQNQDTDRRVGQGS